MTERSGSGALKEIRALASKGLLRLSTLAHPQSPSADHFTTLHYQRHNQRRQEHLATLGLPLHGRSVFEVGAGIGDHTTFFLDRGCTVVSSDARPENVEALRARFPKQDALLIDLDHAAASAGRSSEIVYCYGLLYHLSRPAEAIAFMAQHTRDLLLLETCVSFGTEAQINLCSELAEDPTQAVSGTGCRPTRPWVFAELGKHFPHVYMPVTQPCHEEFPIDWQGRPQTPLTRAVFVASRSPIDNPLLQPGVPMLQRRC